MTYGIRLLARSARLASQRGARVDSPSIRVRPERFPPESSQQTLLQANRQTEGGGKKKGLGAHSFTSAT
jgi:hypothetical protein